MIAHTIQSFITEQAVSIIPRSIRFRENNVTVYLRAGPNHMDGDRRVSVIEVANVQVPARYRRKGKLSDLLVFLEEEGRKLGYQAVRVAQVGNEHLLEALRRRGYVETSPLPGWPTMHKRLD